MLIKGEIMKKLINNYIDYMLKYFGYIPQDFSRLNDFVMKYKLWGLWNLGFLIYLLPRFIFAKTKLYLYLKPSWFIQRLKSKYIQAKDFGYKGYDSYEEYDQERRIDWGADMYR